MKNVEIKITELRSELDVKQRIVADILNVKVDTYSKWERGINDMPLQKSNELANYFDVSLDALYNFADKGYKTERKEIDLDLLKSRLYDLRKEHNLTQKELSKKVGFPQRTYANYENGTSVPTSYKLYYIALFYNVSIDYLVGRSDNKEIVKEKTTIKL